MPSSLEVSRSRYKRDQIRIGAHAAFQTRADADLEKGRPYRMYADQNGPFNSVGDPQCIPSIPAERLIMIRAHSGLCISGVGDAIRSKPEKIPFRSTWIIAV